MKFFSFSWGTYLILRPLLAFLSTCDDDDSDHDDGYDDDGDDVDADSNDNAKDGANDGL